MKKSKKVFYSILLGLVIACGIAYMVLYIIYPDKTQSITWQVIDYICNKPLPVIGISVLMLGVITFKIISVIAKLRNKKFSDVLTALQNSNSQLEQVKQKYEQLKELIYQKAEEGDAKLKEVCDAIPNRKVKAIGEKLYGEGKNSDTETENL